MEDSLVYDEQQNNSLGWKKVQSSELANWTGDSDNNSKKLVSDEVSEATKQGYVIAVTEYFYQPENTIKAGQVGSIKLYGSKVLSASEKGIDVKNHTEIIETMGVRTIKDSIPGNYNPKTVQPDEKDNDITSLVITPPTGASEKTITNVVIMIVTLTVLAVAIYFIKKKDSRKSIK